MIAILTASSPTSVTIYLNIFQGMQNVYFLIGKTIGISLPYATSKTLRMKSALCYCSMNHSEGNANKPFYSKN